MLQPQSHSASPLADLGGGAAVAAKLNPREIKVGVS